MTFLRIIIRGILKMYKIYEIADKTIGINIEFDCENVEVFDKFVSKINNRDLDISYFVKLKKINLNNEYKNIYSGGYSDFYLDQFIDNNKIYYFHKYSKDEEYYSCLIEDIKEEYYNKYLYIYPEKKKFCPSITEIFKRINLQGVLLRKEVMILHSSFIIHNNKSILFTAPSGTGKSTQANLWERFKGAEIINGDRSAIGTRNGQYFAYGLPFSGSSNICKNKEAPLKAIVALEQSKINSVRKLSKMEAFKILLGQVAINRWNKRDMELAMNLIESLIDKVPVLLLSCRPDKEATDVLNEYLENI